MTLLFKVAKKRKKEKTLLNHAFFFFKEMEVNKLQ